ncbi:alpha/beta hydrolase [Streptoverticillium reticulum]|uniref:alpha/beta hydrolase n=1 Tax=Streptoverticillium reticulum TaxID=1433415 RepID=UPI0039BFEBA2
MTCIRTRSRRASRTAVTAMAVAGALVAGGCSSDGTPGRSEPRSAGPSGAPARAAGSGLPPLPAHLARQRLDWGDCTAQDAGPAGFTLRPDADCTWLAVPVDYAAPAGSTLRIRVARVRARDAERRLGALVFNPGGPGEPGAALVADGAFEATPDVAARYDLVAFDPRGIGRSAPLHCPEGNGSDLIPRTAQQADAEFRAAAAQGQDCRRVTGALLGHMDSVSVARDMDLLRAALDEQRLNYLGVSYGTFIGQHYARLFPDHVGRFVLDSVVDPAADQTAVARGDMKALDASFASYARTCAANACPLGRTADEIIARTTQFVRALDAAPLPGPDGSRLTTGIAAQGIRGPLYQAEKWPDLTLALADAMAGRPGALIGLAAEQIPAAGVRRPGAPPVDVPADDPTMPRNAVDCLDRPGPRSASQLLSYVGEFDKASPLFGATVAAAMFHCAAWPIAPTGRAEPVTAPGAPAVVLVSFTVDPATPLDNAKAVQKNLGGSVLVVREGTGHAAYGGGSECTDRAVDGFLVDGRLPPVRVDCAP